ncbi:MAG: 23S rRNA (pseudouridine(1915)-N(3))-methyltransferase RlmH [Oligoflexia bacterium]|nr:23S rRNA (pseudouridine(1915)-N(3))-methyltransferase RlmH [Oligoflexia bacterium]
MLSKILFINFGKFKFKEAEILFEEYLSRLKRYVKTEVKEIRIKKDEPQYMESVREKFLQAIKGSRIMIFSESANSVTSSGFAKLVENTEGILSVVVGTSWGYPGYILEKADYSLNFGKMTLPHELVRVLTAEQLYRAFTIIKGEGYHK